MDRDSLKVGTRAWNKYRLTILQEYGYICQYCGAEATEVDHIIPRNRWEQDEYGQPVPGLNDPDNLTAACKRCNSAKRDRVGVFLVTADTHTQPYASISPREPDTELSIPNGAISKLLGLK